MWRKSKRITDEIDFSVLSFFNKKKKVWFFFRENLLSAPFTLTTKQATVASDWPAEEENTRGVISGLLCVFLPCY